ncbi:flavin-containing monooxygenase [Chitinimonas sp.]|uniref:flavin-containing monooxygenase n=1 Tax=Chitinimonas sp. TaxID=1934313 RepID=UPI0035AFA569
MLDTVVVGAGQAGLAMAYQLKQAGMSYQILEAADQVGGSWPAYYDSLTLFSPARYSSLPGLAFPGEANAYPKRDEVVRYLQDYARHFALPVRTGQRVLHVSRTGTDFELRIADGTRLQARSVVAASGAFAYPYIPKLAGLERFRGRVLHSRNYRRPEDFAGQRVIVIGSANSAVQIADELRAGSRVSLASRRPVRFLPQRLLGRDIHFWLTLTGLDRTRWLDDQSTPVLDDGHYRRLLKTGELVRRPMFSSLTADGVVWADGEAEPVDTLLFATGFRPHVPFLAGLNVFDADGQLRQKNGSATAEAGLYFVGYPRQRNFASATLRGVGPDAAQVLRSLRTCLQGKS